MRKLILILALSMSCFSQTDHFNNVKADGGSTLSGGVSVGSRERDCRVADALKADGITDDSAALQSCYNAAFAAGQGTVLLPAGKIEIFTGLNFTNKPGIKIRGAGAQRCRFTGSCGTNYVTLAATTVVDCQTGSVACMDFVGSGSTTLEDLTLNTCNGGTTCSIGFSTGSSIALLFGRDVAGGGVPYFDYSQWVTLKNVQIQMSHNTIINSTFGSIGVYNYGAEQFSTVNSSIYADTPMWFTLTNATLGIGSAYQTLAAPASMNGIHLQTTDLWYTSGTGSGLVAEGSIGAVQIDNTVGLHTSPIASALTSPAFLFLGSGTAYLWTIKGQIENQNSTGSNGAIINTNHNLDHFNVDIGLAGYVGSGSPAGLIQWNGQTGLTLSNSQIRTRNINGTAVPLVQNTANTISGTTLDLSSTLNPASFSALTLNNVDIWATGFTDANLTFAAGAKYTLRDNTGLTLKLPNIDKATALTLTFTEGNAPAQVSNLEILYADSVTHRLRLSSNAGAFDDVVTLLSTDVLINKTLVGTVPYGRFRGNQGTALAVTDFALGGNWGTTPSVLATLGGDSNFLVTVQTGGGAPAANPTITLTFKDGTWGSTPICIPSRQDINAPLTATWSVDRASSNATAMAFTFVGLPVAGTAYNLTARCEGK